jgi:hypothetical protein
MWEHGKDKDPVEFLDDRGIVKRNGRGQGGEGVGSVLLVA